MKKFFKYLLSLFLLFTIVSCGTVKNDTNNNNNEQQEELTVVTKEFEGTSYTVYKNQPYNTKYEVAIYIHYYHELPKNYYTKSESKEHSFSKEWTKENKMSIGGDHFGNREGRLPSGVSYTECDINSVRTSRGAERIVFSDTFIVYYTPDHYKTFEEIIF